MNQISCIVIDDEPLALGLIVSYVNKTPFLRLNGSFDNPIDAMEFLQKGNKPQLIFLDIEMQEQTGVEFAKTLPEDIKVIFITAYEKYALEGYRLHATDYLLKPVSYELFLQSAEYAYSQIDLFRKNEKTLNEDIDCQDSYIFIKSNSQLLRIDYKDILYFEGLKDYIKLYLRDKNSPIVFYATMKSIEEKLPHRHFMRVHRSYIVNLNEVKTIEKGVILFGESRIPVSSGYKEVFDEFIRKNFFV